jgi:hypothetical protein
MQFAAATNSNTMKAAAATPAWRLNRFGTKRDAARQGIDVGISIEKRHPNPTVC